MLGATRALYVLLCLIAAGVSSALHAQQAAMPPDLEAWRGWVLEDQQHLRCPFLASAPVEDPQSLLNSISARNHTTLNRHTI